MDKVDTAAELFNKGLSCSQSVLAVFADDMELDRNTAHRIAAVFGGGIARRADTCGAVTGALIVIGLRFSTGEMNDRENKDLVYSKAAEFLQAFTEIHDNTHCRDLLGYDISTEYGKMMVSQNNLSQKLCCGFVEDAVKILEKLTG